MIRSMTGFGSVTESGGGLSVRAEVRSVNHRHIQVKLRMPMEFAHLESQADALLRKKLRRGSVSATVSVSRLDAVSGVSFDHAAAARYAGDLRRLADDLELDGGVGIADLIGLPGVLRTRDESQPSDKEGKFVLRVFGKAVGELVAMRVAEGESLAADLEKNVGAVETTVARIGKRFPKVVAAHHKNLKRRVDELVGDAGPVPSSDLARELALIADRLDIGEELARLASHVEQLRKALGKGEGVGRRLDFLAQELFREANTIGSKASDAQVAHAVVDLKTHIERLREQVQNVE